jgi:hypothetical protein
MVAGNARAKSAVGLSFSGQKYDARKYSIAA